MSRDEELAELVVSAALAWFLALHSEHGTLELELTAREVLMRLARDLYEHRS